MNIEKYQKFINALKQYKNNIIYIVGHQNEDVDSLVSSHLLKKILNYEGFDCHIAVHSNFIDSTFQEKFEKITNTKIDKVYNIKNIENEYVILVDHHGLDYANCKVIGFIDHHFDVSIKDFKENYNYAIDDLVINEKASANAYILYQMIKYQNNDITNKKDVLLLTLLAMYCDTDAFTSTKTNILEKENIMREAHKNIINPDFYINDFKRLGYGLTNLNSSIGTILNNGKKTFNDHNIKIVSSYIHVESKKMKNSLQSLKIKLIDEMKKECIKNKDNNSFCRVLIIKDFSNFKTYEYNVFSNKIIEKKYNTIVSRGQDIMPKLIKELNFYSYLNKSYDNAINELYNVLNNQQLQISTMESCTSGLIASSLTDIEGASSIIKGSLITYSNEAKKLFGILPSTIIKKGVYSFETAQEMANSTKNIFQSNIGVGITGSFSNVDINNPDSKSGEIYLSLYRETEFNNIKIYIDCVLLGSRHCQKREVANISLAYLYSLL